MTCSCACHDDLNPDYPCSVCESEHPNELELEVKEYIKSLPTNMTQTEQIRVTMQEITDTYDLNPNDEKSIHAFVLDTVQCRFCSICKKETDCRLYGDCEGLFDSWNNKPLCNNCHINVFNSLERKCRICGSKIRNCCC